MRIVRTSSVCPLITVALVFQFSGIEPASAQGTNPPRTTLQQVLDPLFADMGERCMPGRHFRRIRPTRTPTEVASAADLGQQVDVVLGADLVPLLRFVYAQESLADWRNNKTNQSRFLPYIAEDYRPNPHFNNALYVTSCMSMLNAAISGNVGGNLPVAELRSTVDAEFNQTRRKDLVLMRGRFESPLYHALHNGGPDALTAYLAVWKWYVDQEAEQSGMSYLSNLTGWIITDVTNFSRSVRAAVDASASGNWLVGGFNTSLGAQAKTNAQMLGTNFQVLALMEDPTNVQVGWEPLPTIDKIRQELNAAVQYQPHPNPAFRYVAPGTVQRHLQTITGIPNTPQNQMCRSTEWSQTGTLKDPAQGTIRLVGVAPDPADRTMCVFEVEFVPSAQALQGVRSGAVKLEYSIEAKRQAGVRKLSFDASAEVETSEQPTVRAPRQATSAQIVTASREVLFSVPFTIVATNVPINTAAFPAPAPNDQPASLTCGAWHKEMSVTIGTSGGGLYTVEGRFQLDSDPASWPTVIGCTLTTSISLPRPLGPAVTRNFEALVSIDVSQLPRPQH